MQNRIIITISDYERLMVTPGITTQLAESLSTAKLLPPDKVESDVVTMNSRVKLKDVINNRAIEITVTYPQDSNMRERRVSVFSEIGRALIGRKKSDIVSWKIPHGMGVFEVEEVTYQPEAAGDFYL